jgi:peptide deformylase
MPKSSGESRGTPISFFIIIVLFLCVLIPDRLLVAKILMRSKMSDTYEEGCLSFPDTHTVVHRRVRVDIKYFDLSGVEKAEKLDGFAARIVQHEIDHLNGVRKLF